MKNQKAFVGREVVNFSEVSHILKTRLWSCQILDYKTRFDRWNVLKNIIYTFITYKYISYIYIYSCIHKYTNLQVFI